MNKFKFESHFHTKESSPCGKVSARSGIELYHKAGYNGIVVTDHFSQSVLQGPKESNWLCIEILVQLRKILRWLKIMLIS